MYRSLIAILLSTWFGMVYATGPSYADIRIVPLAVNDHGIVLFKTRSHLNQMGAHTMEGVEYGWLVASAGGIWDEVVQQRISREQSEDLDYLRQQEAAFEERGDLRNPSVVLKALMDKYRFVEKDSAYVNRRGGDITWYPDRFCAGDKCRDESLRQRSLHGIVSVHVGGFEVASSFFCCGMALLRNRYHYEEGMIGAEFDFSSNGGETFSGFDIWTIDAIAIREW